ncbi:type I restriction enzyme R subunit [Brachybacterium muris]|uniref:type I restriction endonuclease subunit R n=1 Tax=Brachybacterium muris TaxID=219301 RepID=UPI00195CFF23|nr:DEAD/DEAH box helicase family protein [Brachybacterium muris]MBM7501101.1 type I restriction enzyme R subunit [Brachybacterium muris]MCT2296821.1 DEAD/DEAH box helicase family protein [Brachybacterium muris]
MAGIDGTRESVFETDIAEHLAAHGWEYSATDEGYDVQRALWPEDVHWWLSETQPEEYAKVVRVGTGAEQADREALLDALVSWLDTPMLSGGGTLNVLRRKFSHTRGATANLRMCQFKPATTLNREVTANYEKVRLRVVRQVHFSPKRGDNRSIDLVFFVNGIPVATCELKSFFKQEVRAAITQYRKDRDPAGQPLLGFGNRALVHFAVDNGQVHMTTKLAGEKTYFLPFNRGHADTGASGNPANPDGSATSYLWEEVLQRDAWLAILGSQMFLKQETSEDPATRKIKRSTALMFPRYHQWRAVTKLVDSIAEDGPGQRYLIEHSAGSGKTNTIAWTAHRLARLHDVRNEKVFDKVLIVSDRKVLDAQLQQAVEQVDGTKGTVAVIDSAAVRSSGGSKSRALLDALTGSALIIVVTLQTFPHVKGLLETTLGDRNFAVIIDEAHTSQSGKSAAELKKVLTDGGEVTDEDDLDSQDIVNDLVEADVARERTIAAETAARAGARNVSLLAFTATPKHKTKELFGRAKDDGLPVAFDVYTMRQAIEEDFILDVLRGYQSYRTAFEIEQHSDDGIVTSITGGNEDQLVDQKVATRKIMRFAKLHRTNIGQKVEIIVEHFHANVAHLLDGHAKAMVVTDSRQAAVRYKVEVDKYLHSRNYGYKSIVAFSGSLSDDEYHLEDVTEASMNPGLGSDLAREFRRPEYRLMLVADKFQTGFDQPLLCAMYVDKKLPDVHAVQTLSRLNRTYRAPSGEKKERTFVLDFVNEPEEIREAFLTYYTEAHIEKATDPNLVHKLATKLAQTRIYTPADVERFAEAWWAEKESSGRLARAVTPALEEYCAQWEEAASEEDSQTLDELRTFKKDCGSYVRLYDFMSQVVDYGTTDLEKLAEFLRQLVRVLPSEGVEPDVDVSGLELRRVRQIDRGKADIGLGGDEETPTLGGGYKEPGTGGSRPDPQLVLLSEIVDRINALFGSEFADPQIEGFVVAAAGMAGEDPRIADQIDHNALDQFMASPELRETLTDAAVLNEGAFGKLTGALTGENDRADEFIRLIGTYLYQSRRMRTDDAPEDIG